MTEPATPSWHVDQTAYQHWIEKVEIPFRRQLEIVTGPLISIVLTTYNTPESWLRQALDSVLSQRYRNWQLCIADDASTVPVVQDILHEYQGRDERITLCLRRENGGIALAGNSALQLAKGAFIAFMDHDDCLPDHSLACVAQHLKSHPQSRLLYSDSDHLDEQGERCRPYFKPAYNEELLLGQNYLNHLTVIDSTLVLELNGLREGFDGSQDYDLLLRAVELLECREIQHIPQVLYHWREVPDSVSRSDIARAAKAAREAVRQHLERQGITAQVNPAANALIYNQVEWPLPSPAPQLTVLVMGNNPTQAQAAAKSVAASTDYPAVEFTPWTSSPGTSGQVDLADLVKSDTTGDSELVCIIPPGFLPETSDWAQRLAALAMREDSGCIGAVSVDASSKEILNPPAVIFAGPDSKRSLNSNYWGSGKGYFGGLALGREVSVLDAGVVMLRMDHWRQCLNRIESLMDSASPQLQLSIACAGQGLRNRWTPTSGFADSTEASVSLLDDENLNELLAQLEGEDINFNAALVFCRNFSTLAQS